MIVVPESDRTSTVSLDALKWNDEGLIPAIVQDAENGEVLMMAWMDEPALEGHARDRADAFLLAIAAFALAQRGDLGARAACRVDLRSTAMATCS